MDLGSVDVTVPGVSRMKLQKYVANLLPRYQALVHNLFPLEIPQYFFLSVHFIDRFFRMVSESFKYSRNSLLVLYI